MNKELSGYLKITTPFADQALVYDDKYKITDQLGLFFFSDGLFFLNTFGHELLKKDQKFLSDFFPPTTFSQRMKGLRSIGTLKTQLNGEYAARKLTEASTFWGDVRATMARGIYNTGHETDFKRVIEECTTDLVKQCIALSIRREDLTVGSYLIPSCLPPVIDRWGPEIAQYIRVMGGVRTNTLTGVEAPLHEIPYAKLPWPQVRYVKMLERQGLL